jgi:hypothetical protein
MEILSVANVSYDTTEVIGTKCGKSFILRQYYTNGNTELNYSVFALESGIVGAEVTDDPEVEQMMGSYFSIKNELENGLWDETLSDGLDDDDVLDIDPFK